VACWVSVSLEVPAEDVERERTFWSAVSGGPLPPYLSVVPGTGAVAVHVRDGAIPDVPEPASFPEVRRSRVYQVSLDIPGPLFDEEAARWEELTGGRVEVLGRRPEFAWLRIPDGPRPLDVLLQRLDRHDGPLTAHLDVGTPDRAAEVRRHRALGASLVAEEEFWTVLADPAGLPYCITDRDPATGELTG
jgi:hypothetical protein